MNRRRGRTAHPGTCVFRTLCLSPSDATTEIDATSRAASTGSPIQSITCSILMVSISRHLADTDTAGFQVGAMSQLASSMTAVYNPHHHPPQLSPWQQNARDAMALQLPTSVWVLWFGGSPASVTSLPLALVDIVSKTWNPARAG